MKEIKVIFLDIDGVLNCAKTKERYRGCIGVDKQLLKRLLRLVEKTGAKLVLSSTWRLGDDWQSSMARYGVPVSMRTPYHGGSIRGEEIDEWLRLHPYVKKYAIVDDDSDMLPHQPLFKTTWEEGLTEEVARRIEMHLRD